MNLKMLSYLTHSKFQTMDVLNISVTILWILRKLFIEKFCQYKLGFWTNTKKFQFYQQFGQTYLIYI